MWKNHIICDHFFARKKYIKFLVRWVSAKCFKVKWQLINVNGKVYILHRWNDGERVQPMNSAAVCDEDRICSGLSSGLCQRCRQRGSPWNEPQNIYRSLCNRNITNKKKRHRRTAVRPLGGRNGCPPTLSLTMCLCHAPEERCHLPTYTHMYVRMYVWNIFRHCTQSIKQH